jgi:signal peptidase I
MYLAKSMTAIFSPYRKRISFLRWMVSLALVVVLMWIWALFLRGELRSFTVISGSMEPTLRIGDYVLTHAWDKKSDLRGRIIAFEDVTHPGEIVTKRVVGMPGDHVAIVGPAVLINTKLFPIPWQRSRAAVFRSLTVPPGHVFVLGDNRGNSVDSLDYGPVPFERIVGVVFLRYWPLSQIGFIK